MTPRLLRCARVGVLQIGALTLLACPSRTTEIGAADTGMNSTSGDESGSTSSIELCRPESENSECEPTTAALETLACSPVRIAWELAVSEEDLEWISGSTSPDCPAYAPCGNPAVFRMPLSADSIVQLSELTETPRYISQRISTSVATTNSVLELDSTHVPHELDNQGAAGLATDGAFLYWIGKNDRSIWKAEQPRAWESERLFVAQAAGSVVGFSANSGVLAWGEYDERGAGSIVVLEDGGADAITVATNQPLITQIVVVGRRVYWLTLDGTLLAKDTTSLGDPVIVAEPRISTFAAYADDIYVGQANEDATFSILAISETDELPQEVVRYTTELPAVAPSHLSVVGNSVYWTDRCIRRIAL